MQISFQKKRNAVMQRGALTLKGDIAWQAVMNYSYFFALLGAVVELRGGHFRDCRNKNSLLKTKTEQNMGNH